MQGGGRVCRLGRLPLPFELGEGPGEASREAVRDVVVARNREHGPPQAAQKAGRLRELFSAPAVAQISTCNHELGLETIDQDGNDHAAAGFGQAAR